LNAESPIQLLINPSSTSWWSVIGGASGSRFEIWSGAFNMIKAFPLVGVGQGNFYHLSADIAFSKSHFLALNGGENAHNYFFQTFAELGLVGILLFVLAFILPIMNDPHRKVLLPPVLGIIALFLGNIYAHSFLVRENLLVCATILGLLYALAWSDQSASTLKSNLWLPQSKRSQLLGFVVCFLLASASLYEVYQSFYTKIFDIGVNCFQPRPLTEDGWTSGVYEVLVSDHARGVKFIANRPSEKRHEKHQLKMRIDLQDSKSQTISSAIFPLENGAPTKIQFLLPMEDTNHLKGEILRIRIDDCFTPRNIGFNEDSRRLGIQISQFFIL